MCDPVTMPVTGDTVAERDTALGAALRQVRTDGDLKAAGRLAAWIEQRLDERRGLRAADTPGPDS